MWFIIILVFFAIIWCCRRKSVQRQFRRWPGPLGLPFVGILLKVGNLGVFHHTLTRWSKKYGKMFRFKLLGQRSIVLRSASVAQLALGNAKLTGRKPPFFQKYVFNDKSFAFANYEGNVPRLLQTFKHVLYWNWELRETSDQGLELCIKKIKRQLIKKGKPGYDPNKDIRNLMTDMFTCLHQVYNIHPRRKLPGPRGYPIIGNLLDLIPSRVPATLDRLGKKYGPVCQLKIFQKKVVVLNSISAVNKVLKEQGDITSDRISPFFQEYVFENKAFGFRNYSKHASGQKLILKTYLQRQIHVHDSNQENPHVCVEKLLTSVKNEREGKIDSCLKSFLTDYFSRQLTGESLPEDDPDYNALWEFIDLLYTLLEPSIDGPLKAFPFLRFLPGKHGRTFRDTIKARDRVAKRYFDSQKATYREGVTRGLIDVCLKKQADEIKDTGTSWLTDDYIKGLMYDTVAAGMTEMMKTLRLLILLMCHHQDCQRRVQQEIDDVIGHLDKPTANHRKDMPYTEAVIMEMMRYVSQTPLAIPHKCNKDVILDGYLIEKDSGIFPNLWGIHHDESVWGDPWEFRPERFLDDDNQILPPDHKLIQSFIPFSVGKRRCPGQTFAMSRTFVIFTSLLQQIHFVPPEEEELPSADPRLYTTKYPLYMPLFKCKAIPRTS